MVPTWMWSWAWRWMMRWGRLDIDAGTVDVSDRWAIVQFVVVAKLRSLVIRPSERWLQARLPRWCALQRLRPCGWDWYRVDDWRAAEHCRLRFCLRFSLDEGDFIKVSHGHVVAVGWEMPAYCEVGTVSNGEVTD